MQANCIQSPTQRGTSLRPRQLNVVHGNRKQQGCSLTASSGRKIQAAASDTANSEAASTSGRQHLQSSAVHHMYSNRSQHFDRRQLLLAVSTLTTAAVATQYSPAQAAAAALGSSCHLQDSKTGLQWCDITVGEGQLPIKSAFTKVNYTAKLASSGQVFDSTYQRRQPLIFKVGECEMVQAMDVAVLGAEDIPPMREGGKRLVIAPPGPMQRQGVKSLTWVTGLLQAIDEVGEPRTPEGGFNSTLVFEIELMAKRRG